MNLKLLFSVVFACTLLSTSYAQINKGSTCLGSNFSYSKNKGNPFPQSPEQELRRVSILPAVGVAIKENLVLGIFGNYTYEFNDNQGYLIESKIKNYGGGVLVRRYVPIVNRFYVFGEGRLGYNTYETKNKWNIGNVISSGKIKGWNTDLTFTPGISYGVTQNIQLEAGFVSLFNIMYSNAKFTSDNYSTSKLKSFSTDLNLDRLSSFSLGVRFLINKKA
jgi:opacity protein-like surface antigen